MATASWSWPRVGRLGTGSSRKDQGIPAFCRRWFSLVSLKTQQQQQKKRPPQAVLMAESVSASASATAASWSTTTSFSSILKMAWHHEDDDVSQRVTPEKLDQWLRDSIAEIVRNIGEAPFLVYMFSRGRGSNARPRLEREAATPEVWSRVTRRWGSQESCMPDGIVLVEELIGEEEVVDGSDHCQRTWGLLVQGRGMECPASCYILSTCRVGFCTHFCLARAKCFGESIDKQLRRAWLQQEQPPR